MYSKLQDGNFIICGFVARDAELKTVGANNSSLCKWSVKVGERPNGGKKEAIWTNCQAWHDTARAAANIKKGDIVLCVGKLETNEHEGKTYKNLVCEFVSVMKKAPEHPQTGEPYTANTSDLSAYEEILGSDEPPF